MAIATCGHEVEEGIKCIIIGHDLQGRACQVCVSYCPDCVIRAHRSGDLLSSDINKLISKIVKADWTD